MNGALTGLVLVLAPVLTMGQDSVQRSPWPHEQERGVGAGQEGSPRSELPEYLAAMLEEIRLAREGGDLDAARAVLKAIFDEGPYEQLLAEAHAVVLAGLSALEQTAESMSVPELGRRVQTERVERLSATLAEDHADLLDAEQALGSTLYLLGDFAGAHALFEAVHSSRARLLPADHPDFLEAEQNLAVTLKAKGDLAGALALEEHLHAVRERLLPADHRELLITKSNLALTRYALRDLTGARDLLEEVHANWERRVPADHPDLVVVKLNLSSLRNALGDLTGALELLEVVHAVWERRLPADHPDLLLAKVGLGALRHALGDLAGARAIQEDVYRTRAQSLAADHPDVLGAEQNLALTLSAQGDLAGALALEEHVHAARELALSPDHHDLLMAKQNLAATRHALGDLDGALALLEHVHAAWRRQLPADHPDVLLVELNLAGTLQVQGDLARAVALIEHVHEARRRTLPADHPDLLAAKQNLAGARQVLGDFEGALALLEHVVATWERLLPPDHADLLGAQLNLASLRYLHGDREEALALLEHVYSARERLLPADHPDLLGTQQNLAFVRAQLGDHAGALALTRSALEGILAVIAGLHGEAPRHARAAAVRQVANFSEALFVSELATAAGNEPLDAALFGVLESLRIASTSYAEFARAAAHDPELSLLRERVAARRRELSALILSPPADAAELAAWRAALFEQSEERDRLEKELRTKIARQGLAHSITPATVGKTLAPGSAWVSFLRYSRRSAEDPETRQAPPAVDSLLAFVVTPDSRVRRIELGASAEIEELSARWRASVGRPVAASAQIEQAGGAARGVGVGASAANDEQEVALGAELRGRVLDPCLAALEDDAVSTVHLVLDDFLHLVPWDALPRKDGKPLGETLRLRIVTSARRLISPASSPTEGVLLAVGGVDFDAGGGERAAEPATVAATPLVRGSPRSPSAPSRFEPLGQTLPEVEALAALFAEHRAEEPVVLQGRSATKSALQAVAPRARYLHVATHGWFAPETFTSMIDGLEEESERAFFVRAGEDVRGFAPETLCGLALAGANRGANSPGEFPGILTAEELATLGLWNCELAVLSACETNVGLRRAGQGIHSLQAALHAAGARTAITSLWRVDDAATRRLMETFYAKLWVDGLGKAEALWQSKMVLRSDGYPVRDWAAWVLTGEPD